MKSREVYVTGHAGSAIVVRFYEVARDPRLIRSDKSVRYGNAIAQLAPMVTYRMQRHSRALETIFYQYAFTTFRQMARKNALF